MADSRFWEKLVPIPECGCWLWLGAVNAKGYGHFYYAGKVMRAHRASWLMHRGKIPRGRQVLHKCDVRSCVNPAHLFLGNNADNVKDKVAKGRQSHTKILGEASGTARLDENKVRLIRRSKAFGTTLAKKFGVAPSTIHTVRRNETWSHVK